MNTAWFPELHLTELFINLFGREEMDAMKNQLKMWAMKVNLPGIVTGITKGTGLNNAMRSMIHRFTLAFFLAIIGAALVFSIVHRMRTGSFSVREEWDGKSWPLSIVLSALLGGLGVHRFYLGRVITGILQLLGTAIFVLGAYLLSNATMLDFMLMTEEVIAGLMIIITGFAFQIWRILDLFLILFGGLTPRHRRKR